jgi:hypothetical protein
MPVAEIGIQEFGNALGLGLVAVKNRQNIFDGVAGVSFKRGEFKDETKRR